MHTGDVLKRFSEDPVDDVVEQLFPIPRLLARLDVTMEQQRLGSTLEFQEVCRLLREL